MVESRSPCTGFPVRESFKYVYNRPRSGDAERQLQVGVVTALHVYVFAAGSLHSDQGGGRVETPITSRACGVVFKAYLTVR